MLQSADVPVEAKLFAATTLKGKVKQALDPRNRTGILTVPDYVRSRSITSGVSGRSKGFGTQSPCGFWFWPSTYTNTTLRVSSQSCDPDGRMEGRLGYRRLFTRKQCGRLRAGVSQDPPGRSDGGAQDQSICMFGKLSIP